MKARLFSVVLFVLVSLSPAAYAQYRTVTVEYENFTFDYLSRFGADETPDLQLISDTGGETIFAMPYISGVSLTYAGREHLEWDLSTRFLPKPGYQMVGYEIIGSVTGMVWAEQPPDSPDVTRVILADPQNAVAIGHSFRINDLNGTQDIEWFAPGGATITGHDYLDLIFYGAAIIHRGSYQLGAETYGLDAEATLQFHEFRFIVYTAPIPVPEPNAWLMLGIGLVPIGWAARRKTGDSPAGTVPGANA